MTVKLRKDSQENGPDKQSDNQDPNQYWQGPPKNDKKPPFMTPNNPKNRFALIVFATLAILFAYMFFLIVPLELNSRYPILRSSLMLILVR